MCATVVADSSMSTPYSQDLSCCVIKFAWNLGLTREEIAFYLGVYTWTVEYHPRGDTKVKCSLFY